MKSLWVYIKRIQLRQKLLQKDKRIAELEGRLSQLKRPNHSSNAAQLPSTHNASVENAAADTSSTKSKLSSYISLNL